MRESHNDASDEPLVAMLLAAGVGSRLRPLTDARPKCLVPVNGESFLHRAVRVIGARGIERFIIVTGYKREAVHAALEGLAVDLRFVHSDAYDRTQNSVSMALGARALGPGEACIKLDADVLFVPEVIDALCARVRAAHAQGTRPVGAVAVDAKQALGAEEMKLEVDSDRAVRFGKGLDPARCAGESIGIELFDAPAIALVREALERAMRQGRTDLYYEDVYNDVLATLCMHPVPVGSGAWTEVDDLADLARAERMFAKM